MNNNEILLLKLGEVVLKGLNRRSFEDKLVSNVRRRMKPCGSFQIYIRQSTIYVEPQTEDCERGGYGFSLFFRRNFCRFSPQI